MYTFTFYLKKKRLVLYIIDIQIIFFLHALLGEKFRWLTKLQLFFMHKKFYGIKKFMYSFLLRELPLVMFQLLYHDMNAAVLFCIKTENCYPIFNSLLWNLYTGLEDGDS